MTTNALSEDEVADRLVAFVRERFLSGDPDGELTDQTPLLEWGILNSLNTAILVGYIREEFETSVPLERIDAVAFRNARTIAALLTAPAAEVGR